MSAENDLNADRERGKPGDSLSARPTTADDDAASIPGRDRPQRDSAPSRPQPDQADRSIRPWDLIPFLIILIGAWLWLLDVLPWSFTSSEAGGGDFSGILGDLIGGLALALAAAYFIWLARRFARLNRYKTKYRLDVKGPPLQGWLRKDVIQRLRGMAFIMVAWALALILELIMRD